MKRVLFGALALVSTAMVLAQDSEIKGELKLTYATKDIWRGTNLVDESVLYGKVLLNYDQYRAYILGRMEMTDTNSYPLRANPSGTVTAVRGGLFYMMDNPTGMDLELGVVTHQYPGVGSPQTWEAYYGLNFGGQANFTLAVFQDIEVVKGYRIEAIATHKFPGGFNLPGVGAQGITLTLKAAYGDSKYNQYYYGADTSTLTDLFVGASTSFSLGQYEVSPFLNYTSPLDPDILKGATNRTNLYVGFGVAMKF